MNRRVIFVARLVCVSGLATAIGCLAVIVVILDNSQFTILDDNPPLVVALAKSSQFGVAAGAILAVVGGIACALAKTRPPTI